MLSETKAADVQSVEIVSCDDNRALVENEVKDLGLVEDERRAKQSKLDIVMDDAQADPDNRTVMFQVPHVQMQKGHTD